MDGGAAQLLSDPGQALAVQAAVLAGIGSVVYLLSEKALRDPNPINVVFAVIGMTAGIGMTAFGLHATSVASAAVFSN